MVATIALSALRCAMGHAQTQAFFSPFCSRRAPHTGVLYGRWFQDFPGGVAPGTWSSTIDIIDVWKKVCLLVFGVSDAAVLHLACTACVLCWLGACAIAALATRIGNCRCARVFTLHGSPVYCAGTHAPWQTLFS